MTALPPDVAKKLDFHDTDVSLQLPQLGAVGPQTTPEQILEGLGEPCIENFRR